MTQEEIHPHKMQLSILIVDDEPTMVDMLKFMLAGFGHKIAAVAKTGKEAVNMAAQVKPDLIILDIGLPDMNGLDAAAMILAERVVPIIIGTGCTQDEILQRAIKLNLLSYLIKPYRNVQLESSIRMAMIRHQQSFTLTNETQEMTNKSESMKVVNRTLELMIDKLGLSRNEAVEKLKIAAKARGCSPLDAAKAICATLGHNTFQLHSQSCR